MGFASFLFFYFRFSTKEELPLVFRLSSTCLSLHFSLAKVAYKD